MCELLNSARIHKKRDIMSLSGISNILPLNLENRLKIIKIAKHPVYPDSRFSRQLAHLRILILRKARSGKVKTNKADDARILPRSPRL